MGKALRRGLNCGGETEEQCRGAKTSTARSNLSSNDPYSSRFTLVLSARRIMNIDPAAPGPGAVEPGLKQAAVCPLRRMIRGGTAGTVEGDCYTIDAAAATVKDLLRRFKQERGRCLCLNVCVREMLDLLRVLKIDR